MVDQMEAAADTGREIDVFPYVKRCALDIIAGQFAYPSSIEFDRTSIKL